MKKVFAIPTLALILSAAWILAHQTTALAAPCNIYSPPGYPTPGNPVDGCGYFTGSYGDAPYNVLPGAALTGVPNSNGAGVFQQTLQNDLYSNNYQASLGAAFLIDFMLGRTSGGGRVNGIAAAKNNFSAWQALVNSYASSSTPGYGVDWNYDPGESYFCSHNVVYKNGYVYATTSAFSDIGDDVFYHYYCGDVYWSSRPEIRFYWPGGSLEIGKACGNIQHSYAKPPTIPTNHVPTGTISVQCTNKTLGQQTATITFSDQDGPTTGYITINGWQSGSYSSGGPYAIAIPTSVTSPYNAQNVYLHVKDVGPAAPPNTYAIFSASTQVPCVAIGCGSAVVNPARLDPYMTNFAVTVTGTFSVSQAPPNATVSLKITPPSGATFSYSGSKAASANSGLLSAKFVIPGPTGKTGLYALSWTIAATGVSPVTCVGTMPVVYLPYLNVYGGDVMTGASPVYNASASTCSALVPGGMYSWNNEAAGYSGAGTQYAIEAAGQIQDFASAVGSTNTPPVGLSFANSYKPANPGELNPPQGLFGGNFGAATSDCDFTSDLTGAQQVTGSKTFGTTSVSSNNDVWFVKGGNVYISGDITYATTSWGSPSSIPYFKLVVAGGNIYIGSGVKQLDGIFVAEPSSGGGGIIYTCAKGIGLPWVPQTDFATGYYGACNQRLTINGAFVAAQVQFLRTGGSIGQAKTTDSLTSNHDAEIFNYTPEIWLPRGAKSPNGGYDAITGLPPVL